MPGGRVFLNTAGPRARAVPTSPPPHGVQSACRPVREPLPADDPKVRQPDITRARTLLHWEPKVTLEEGLLKTIDYFRTKVS